jgi:hypothetical protein
MAVGNLQIAGREADSVLAVALAWEQAIGR